MTEIHGQQYRNSETNRQRVSKDEVVITYEQFDPLFVLHGNRSLIRRPGHRRDGNEQKGKQGDGE